jgi:serralysin
LGKAGTETAKPHGQTMCILCNARPSTGFSADGWTKPDPLYGQGATSGAAATGAQPTDGLISGFKWASTTLTFALPATAASYPDYDPLYDETGSFSAVTGALATAVRAVLSHVSQYTGLTITETSNASLANIRVGRTADTATAHAYLPDGSTFGGDVWIGTSSDYNAPVRGDYAWATILHELGHALGLKHAHSYIGGAGVLADDVGVTNLPVNAAQDSLEYTVMSYRSYANQNLAVFDYYTNETAGYPQSLMMLDIAALQAMYGADFTTNNTNTVYSFSTTTGEMSVNGVSEGALAGNRIFRTIWDGGGIDTYNFSNYTTSLQVNLTPGSSSLLSATQRVNLGNNNYAAGNLYNALQSNGDARSLIENAIGGSGNDTITGNSANNTLTGGTGNDSFVNSSDFDTITDFVAGGTDDSLNIAAIASLSDFAKAQGLAAQVGADTILTLGFNNVVTLKNVTLGALTAADFTLAAAAPNNTMNGTVGPDTITGTGGVDSIIGGTGNDTLGGFNGNDTLSAGDNDDYLYGGAGDNLLEGGSGIDVMIAEAGNDTLIGGDGTDYFYAGTGNNVLSGGAGTDVFISEGANDIMNGGSDHNFFYRYGTGGAYILGGDGIDEFAGGNAASNDTFEGGGGLDYGFGGDGNDVLNGGAGNDVLIGQNGNDTIDGGAGVNLIWCNDVGNDQVRINTADAGTQVIDFFEAGGANDSVRILGSNLTSFADFQNLVTNYNTAINGNLVVNTATTGILYLNLGANQTAIWFQGIAVQSLTAADFTFG